MDTVALNYVGILYYFAAIFYLLGLNPLIAALANSTRRRTRWELDRALEWMELNIGQLAGTQSCWWLNPSQDAGRPTKIFSSRRSR